MRIIEPFPVTPAMMVDTNIPEDDYPAWSNTTEYEVKDRVIRQHGIWECVQAHTGQDPLADASSTYWVRLGATNRWRAFDERIGGVTQGGATIEYEIVLPRTLNALAFFGLDAGEVGIIVTIPGDLVIYTNVIDLSTRDLIGNFWEYVHNDFRFKPDLILRDIPLPSGATIEISIIAGVAAEVAEIIIGTELQIGTTLVDTSLGIVDYSKKERDEWGGVFLVPRPVTSTVTFRFSVPTEGAARVQQIMRRISSKLCVFYAIDGEDPFGTTIPGIVRDYDLTLTSGTSFGLIEAESLA